MCLQMPHAPRKAFMSAGILPKRSDLLHVGALGVCLFFNQLMYILGISLSGVLVATCMQPTIPVFTAMLAVCLQLESGSVQKFFGIGLAVLGSMSMVSGKHTLVNWKHCCADLQAQLLIQISLMPQALL